MVKIRAVIIKTTLLKKSTLLLTMKNKRVLYRRILSRKRMRSWKRTSRSVITRKTLVRRRIRA